MTTKISNLQHNLVQKCDHEKCVKNFNLICTEWTKYDYQSAIEAIDDLTVIKDKMKF